MRAGMARPFPSPAIPLRLLGGAEEPALSEAEWVEAWWRWTQKDSAEGQPPLSPSASCQARARLDLQTLRLIHGPLAWSLERRVPSAPLWLGRRVQIVDGTTLSMPDTAANQQSWPQSSSQGEGLGFPCLKPFRQAQGPEFIEGLAGLFSLASGGLADDATGTLPQQESLRFRTLWERLEKGDWMLGDRGFCSSGARAGLCQRGIDKGAALASGPQGELSRRSATRQR